MTTNFLCCPLDQGQLHQIGDYFSCSACGSQFPNIEVTENQPIPDFRCLDQPGIVSLDFSIPQKYLEKNQIDKFGLATHAKLDHFSREEIRKKFGTKLQKEIFYYVEKHFQDYGTEVVILDLGCGSGGNKKFLQDFGFNNIISVDYWSPAAEYLVDAHRLPFRDETFDLVISTSTLEHFYNPFIAIAEISRVLKSKGAVIASGSFWESWHGNSCFHFTPNGLYLLCESANLNLVDLWSGWGFIPSITSHALGLKKLKPITYKLQTIFDKMLEVTLGKQKTFQHRLMTSGSFGIYAQKRMKETPYDG